MSDYVSCRSLKVFGILFTMYTVHASYCSHWLLLTTKTVHWRILKPNVKPEQWERLCQQLPDLKVEGRFRFNAPMLTATNYTVWAMRMKITLKVQKVWEAIEGDVTEGDKNDMAIALLFQSISKVLILQNQWTWHGKEGMRGH